MKNIKLKNDFLITTKRKTGFYFLEDKDVEKITSKVLNDAGIERAKTIKNAIHKENVLFYSKKERNDYVKRVMNLNYNALCPLAIDSNITDVERNNAMKTINCKGCSSECMNKKESCWSRFLQSGRIILKKNEIVENIICNSK
ncbi:MAG: hypothetical protein J6J27_00060 [Alphaproteobacteria bacterium]|nr:hypothetical protein [Alphaproteobacteria bacterium]